MTSGIGTLRDGFSHDLLLAVLGCDSTMLDIHLVSKTCLGDRKSANKQDRMG